MVAGTSRTDVEGGSRLRHDAARPGRPVQDILLQLWSSIPSFRGEAKETTSALRPRLGFGQAEIAYLPPETELEKEDPVALTIEPIEPQT